VIAVARDRAFCFYYRENLALLEELGARLRAFFSPLADRGAARGHASALYLGGGYPELYAAALWRTTRRCARAVREAAVTGGMPAFCRMRRVPLSAGRAR
jgi:cobyrinic acid a,c-diamide synthase